MAVGIYSSKAAIVRVLRLEVSEIAARHWSQNWQALGEKSTADNTFSDEDSTPRNVFKDGSGSLSADAAVEEINSESTVNFKMEKVVRIFEDIGVPEDGQWDFVAVHGYRFCPQHKEVEYLLEYADKWMRPSDFGFEEAEVELEAMLQEYESRHNKNNVSIHLSQTNCRDGLWSQVDTPIQSGVSDGEAVYLLHWKLFWTFMSDINYDDK